MYEVSKNEWEFDSKGEISFQTSRENKFKESKPCANLAKGSKYSFLVLDWWLMDHCLVET